MRGPLPKPKPKPKPKTETVKRVPMAPDANYRMDCLRMALQQPMQNTADDPMVRAKRYADFVLNGVS
jgi:hypothetical protein